MAPTDAHRRARGEMSSEQGKGLARQFSEAIGRWTGLSSRLTRLEAGWHRHIPAILNATASVAAFGHEILRMRKDLERQIAALRQEVDRLASRARLEPRILAPDKVAAALMAGPRLNLGYGGTALAGYLNIDRRAAPDVDILADAGDLPFDPASVHEVFSAHLPEQVPEAELRGRLLPYWLSLLAPGGTFRAVLSDGEAMLAGATHGSYSFEELRAGLFGAPGEGAPARCNLFTPETFSRLIREAGFVEIEVAARGRRTGHGLDFEISAIRPRH
jgi:hypothetical protein